MHIFFEILNSTVALATLIPIYYLYKDKGFVDKRIKYITFA